MVAERECRHYRAAGLSDDDGESASSPVPKKFNTRPLASSTEEEEESGRSGDAGPATPAASARRASRTTRRRRRGSATGAWRARRGLPRWRASSSAARSEGSRRSRTRLRRYARRKAPGLARGGGVASANATPLNPRGARSDAPSPGSAATPRVAARGGRCAASGDLATSSVRLQLRAGSARASAARPLRVGSSGAPGRPAPPSSARARPSQQRARRAPSVPTARTRRAPAAAAAAEAQRRAQCSTEANAWARRRWSQALARAHRTRGARRRPPNPVPRRAPRSRRASAPRGQVHVDRHRAHRARRRVNAAARLNNVRSRARRGRWLRPRPGRDGRAFGDEGRVVLRPRARRVHDQTPVPARGRTRRSRAPRPDRRAFDRRRPPPRTPRRRDDDARPDLVGAAVVERRRHQLLDVATRGDGVEHTPARARRPQLPALASAARTARAAFAAASLRDFAAACCARAPARGRAPSVNTRPRARPRPAASNAPVATRPSGP